MIGGVVSAGRAVMPLTVSDNRGNQQPFEFVVDTGFSGFLSLPKSIVSGMDVKWIHQSLIGLAANIGIEVNVYQASVNWNEEWSTIELMELEGEPLLGMALLSGTELRIQVEEGGLVEIEPL